MTSAAATSTSELRELYRELILDHARNPRHFGKLDGVSHMAEGINPLCGDKLKVYLVMDGDDIRDASFEGSGCAISVASASLLTETVIGMQRDDALNYLEAVVDSLTTEKVAADVDLGKLVALQGVREYPSRVKCATLAWRALGAAINNEEDPASTE
jgi:nitrogen fixation NifU-like protein